jgi:hypothetical protein
MERYVFFLLAAALVSLGAGCLPGGDTADNRLPESPQREVSPVPDKTPSIPREEPDAMENDLDDAEPAAELSPIDDTWNTYENEATGFTFLWPTRGRYAPEWEVSFIADDDSRTSEGCLFDDNRHNRTRDILNIAVDGIELCHTRFVEGAAGSIYYIDYYLGELKGTNVLFTFTKRLANGDNFENESCHGKTVLAMGDSCVPFDDEVYRAHLDQIMATLSVE